MKSIFFLNGKKFCIRPLKTKEELDILEYLFSNSDENEDYNFIVNQILASQEIDLNKFSELEKLLILLKIREVSFGNEINIKFKCEKCKKAVETTIFINNILESAKKQSEKIHGLVEKSKLNEIKIEDFLDEKTINEMDYDEYEEISKNLKDYLDVYNFKILFKCFYCKGENFSNLTARKIIEFISEEDFGTLSKYIHLLVYHGHLTRSDILEMTPLERVFELNLLRETQNEITKKRQENTHN